MVTYLMRHGRTPYSASYRVNGNPAIAVALDEEGVNQCHAARLLVPAGEITTCVTSIFARTAESARLVLGKHQPPVRRVAGLGELDYGIFEGQPFRDYAVWLTEHGPWARPPGAAESQREAITRLLHALRQVLDYPGPRLVVTHGLLVSVVLWAWDGNAQGPSELLFFREAPCAEPVCIDDLELASLVETVGTSLCCDTYIQPSSLPGSPRGQLQAGPELPPFATSSLPAEAPVQEEGTSNA